VGLLSLLFGFKGRINRLQYWGGTIGVGVVGGFLMVAVVFGTIFPAMGNKAALGGALGFMALAIMVIFSALGWSGLSLQWKRFHDRGRPGYLAMLPMLVAVPAMFSLIGHIVSGAPPEAAMMALQPYVMVSSLINLWFFIDLGCLGGVNGPNKYGDPPGGGFVGGGSPSSAPVAPARTAQPQGAGSLAFLGSAEKAMERAIAEQGRAPSRTAAAAPAGARTAAAPGRMATATASASVGPRTAAPAGFGRKPAR
jgi:uncharacterized membrane protein YhaH (DUF805 family)